MRSNSSNQDLLSITITSAQTSSHQPVLSNSSKVEYKVIQPHLHYHSNRNRLRDHFKAIMCHYYAHQYSCKHITYALGKFCKPAGLVQTPCDQKQIWQTIRMGEDCEDCATPSNQRFSVKSKGKGKR